MHSGPSAQPQLALDSRHHANTSALSLSNLISL